MHRLLSLRFALWLLAVLLAVFGVGNAFVAVFAPARYELVYQFDAKASYCAAGQCAFIAQLEVANTGRETQDEVTFTLTGLPPNVGGSPRTLNLDASLPRASDPEIEQLREDEALVIRLRRFTPGTLTQFHFAGSFPERHLTTARAPTVTVVARGRKIEGDPRSIAFGRWFTHLIDLDGWIGCTPA